MGSRPLSVASELRLRLVVPGAASVPVRASLRYEACDPYAVHLTFYAGDGSVEWGFARQLLTDGVSRPTGEGDVSVWPSRAAGRAVVCLSLSAPSGRALFEAPLERVVELLAATYALVPTGSESEFVDLEAGLDFLLRDAAGG